MTLSKSKNYLFWCKSFLNNALRPRITFDEKGWCNACQWMVKNDKCSIRNYKFIRYEYQSSNISLKRHNLS